VTRGGETGSDVRVDSSAIISAIIDPPEAAMSRMQPLRDEHQELKPHIDKVRHLADGIEHLTPMQRAEGVATAYRFLSGQLIPHAEAEDAVLYPAVARVMGTPQATATMSRDHVEVRRMTEDLGRLAAEGATADLHALRRVLYGLYALISVHFAKEEEIYVPLLEEALSAEEADWLFHQLGHVAHRAHAHA
jgi:iron-sulfur cluster repair protein YtfE (RIC family)